jgi:hypothetical protein
LKSAKVIKTIQNIFKIRLVKVKSLRIFARSFEEDVKTKHEIKKDDFKDIIQ